MVITTLTMTVSTWRINHMSNAVTWNWLCYRTAECAGTISLSIAIGYKTNSLKFSSYFDPVKFENNVSFSRKKKYNLYR